MTYPTTTLDGGIEAPLYGFSRTGRHALVQHQDGDWYAHPVTTTTAGRTILRSGRWECPGWMIEGDDECYRHPTQFPDRG